jgi:hypothetical protein
MDQSIVPLVSVAISGIVGISGVALALIGRRESSVLARAVRRTTAMQMLSDEELVLNQVREEVRSFQTIVDSTRDSLGNGYDELKQVCERTTEEALGLLEQVRSKRSSIEPNLEKMSAAEIERVIGAAYHGKVLAEAQLYRTKRSKEDVLSIYVSGNSGAA